MAQALTFAGLLVIASAIATTAQAQIWVGGTTGNVSGWGVSTNWNPSGIPASSGTATFNASTQNTITFPASPPATSIGTLQINNSTSNYFFDLFGGSLNLGSGGINDTSAATITFANGPITGSGGVQLNSTGTLILSGENTYTGATTVGASVASAGTLQVDGSIVSAVDVSGGGTLSGFGTVGETVITRGTLAPGTPDNPTGILTINGAGGLTLSAVAAYEATFESSAVSSSAVDVIGSATLSGTFIAAAAPGSANSFSPADTFTILSASQGVSRTFTNLAVSGSFGNFAPYLTYNSDTVTMGLTPGTVWLGGSATSGAYDWSTAANWAGGTVPTSTEVTNEPASTVATFGGAANNVITVTGGETIGTMLFTSGVTSPFTFAINAGGALTVSGPGILDNSSHPPQFDVGSVTLGGGTLQFEGAATAGDAIIVNNSGGTTIFGGDTTTADTTSAGTATITNSGGETIFQDRATAASATIITNSGGTTTFESNSTAGNAILIVNTGGVVDFNGSGAVQFTSTEAITDSLSVSAGAIEGTGGQIELGGNTLTINAGVAGTSFAGVISDGGLTIAGGTTTLTGVNTYTGATTIDGGTLAVDGGGTIASSSIVDVNSGGTLTGTGTVPSVTVNAGGTLTPGASGIGTLTIDGTLTLQSGADFADTITGGSATEASITGASNKGTATLGGILTVTAGGGSYSGPYTILTTANSTGVNGTFSGLGLVGSFGDQVPYLVYGTNSVQVALTPSNVASDNVWNGTVASPDWSTLGNWSEGVPTAGFSSSSAQSTGPAYVATFTGSGTSNVTINSAANAGTLLFTSGVTSPYTFTIDSGSSLTLNGIGVVDNSSGTGNAPIFTVGGTLTFQNAANAGDAALTVNSGGIVDFSDSTGSSGNDNLTAGSISGVSGGLIYLGSNTLTVGNSSSTTFGGVISSCGTNNTACAASTADSGAAVTGGSLVKVGSGTLTFTGANTYTGATTIDAGTLALSGAGSIATSSSVNVATDGTFDISQTTSGASITTLSGQGSVAIGGSAQTLIITNGSTTFSGVIADGGAGGNLTVTGGTQTLSGLNTYTGTTTVSGGELVLGVQDAIAASQTVSVTGGVLSLGGFSQTFSPATILLSGGGTIENGTIASVTAINSTGGTINNINGGTFGDPTVTASSGTTTLGGTNLYFGTTAVANGATLAAAGADSLGIDSDLTLGTNSTAILDLGSNDQTIASLSGAGTITNASNPTGFTGSNSVVLTIVNGNGETFSGTIQNQSSGLTGVTDILGLTLESGTLTLDGTNTYTGATTVGLAPVAGTTSEQATLIVSSSIATSSGVTVNDDGTLAGTGAVPSVTVNSGGTLAPGSGGAGTLTVDGTLTLNGNYAVTVNTANGSNTEAQVTGTGHAADLSGIFTAVASSNGGYMAGNTYTVLSAPSVSGMFTGMTLSAASIGDSFGNNLVPYLIYPTSGTTVELGLTAGNTWLGTTSSWNTASNWSQGVPTAGFSSTSALSTGAPFVATFNGGGSSAVTINSNSAATAGTLLFTSAVTSPYTFTINGGGSLALNGLGIVDNTTGQAPIFNVGSATLGSGTLQFQYAATAGDANINVGTNGLVQFSGNSTGGTANFTNTGGTVDFSGTLGPAGDGIITVGSILGTGGNYELGANQLVITGTQPSTAVTSIISNCAVGCLGNANGSTGGSLVMDGSGTLTLGGANTYTGGTVIENGTVAITANPNYVTAGTPSSGILNSPLGTGTLTLQGGTLKADFPAPTSPTVAFTNGMSSITWTGSSLPVGTPVYFTTTGSLPTNFTAGQIYYVVSSNAGTITVAATPGGTAIVAGSAGSGTESGVAVFTVANAVQLSGAGGTIDAAAQTLTIAGNITDDPTVPGEGLTIQSTGGAGTVIFSGQNTYTGATTVNANTTLQAGAADSFSSLSAVALSSNNSTLDLNGFNEVIGGLSGTGIVTNSGTQSGTVTGIGATLTVDGGSGTFSGTIENGTNTGGGVLSLAVVGSGTSLTLSGTNIIYTGSTTIGAGAILALSDSGINNSSGLVNNGTFDISGNATGTNTVASLSGTNTGANVVLGANTLTIANPSTLSYTATPYYGAITGSGGLIVDTPTTASPLTLALFGTSTYSGGTTIENDVTLQVGANDALGSGGLTIDSGTLQAGASVSLDNSITVNSAGTFDSHGDTLTLNGDIGGSGAVAVTDTVGGGTIVFAGMDDNYTGATAVNGGTLSVTGEITASSVTVYSGGTLSGTGTIVPAVTVNPGGTLSPGSTSNPTGTLTIGGTLTFASGSSYAVTVNGNSSSEANVTGVTSLAGATLIIGGTAATSTTATVLTADFGTTRFSGIDITGNFGDSLPEVNYGSTEGCASSNSVCLSLIAGNVWTGASGSEWTTNANWTNGQPPTSVAVDLNTSVAAFDATQTKSTTVTVSSTDNVAVGTLLFNSNIMTAAQAITFDVNGKLTLDGDGVVNESSTTTPLFNILGSMIFTDNSSGGNAQYNVASTGILDFSGSSDNSQLSAGSITGSGAIYLGASELAVGSNNLSTTFSGVISDCGSGSDCATPGTGGSINKVGTGTLILSGANTYTGGTTVSAGILQAANANAISSGPLTLNGGTFQAGVSTLNLGNSVTLGTLGGTLDSRGNTLTLSSLLSGSGPLTVDDSVGTGSVILSNTGTSSYTGAFTLDSGTLEADSDFSSASGMTVNGGMLTGTGTLPSTIFNAGILSPGAGPLAAGTGTTPTVAQTLNINGNLTLSSASFYMLTINGSSVPSIAGSNYTQTAVTGAASLGGATLLISGTNSNILLGAGNVYTLITTTKGVTGTLATQGAYASNIGPVQATVATTSNNVTATFQHAQLSAGSLPSGYASFVNTINTLSSEGKLSNSFVGLFNNPNAAAAGLSGQATSGAVPSLTNMQNSFATTLLNPNIGSRGGVPGSNGFGPALGFAPETAQTPDEQAAYDAVTPHEPLDAMMRSLNSPHDFSVWGSVYGGVGKFTGDSASGSQTASTNGAGIASGIDYRWGPDTVVGFALGGGYTNWNLSGGLGGGNSDIFQAGFYGSHRFGDFYVSGALAYALDEMSTNRNVTSPSAANLTANFDANGVTGRIEGGYRFGSAEANLTPYVAGNFSALSTPSYSETTASGTQGFALSYAAQTVTNERAELGLWGNLQFEVGDDAVMRLGAKVGYAHDWWSDDSFNATFVSLPTQGFTLTGVTPPSNLALASLLSELRYANGISFGVKVDGEYGLGSTAYSLAGTGTLKYQW